MNFQVERYMQLLLLLLLILGGTRANAQSTLIVSISGIQITQGRILYSLYSSADGFPDNPQKAYRSGFVNVTERALSLNIASLPPGTYALSVIHDQNGDGRLNVNFVGIPTEPLGFSNKVMGAFGPPKFSKARFTLQPGKNEIPIRLRMGQ
ncbi:MAG: DUF2141 domain-containing protein [Bacteroidetes bacterium]|nr:DUF2141 domain-containing protein [Bacteroidota bacterium]